MSILETALPFNSKFESGLLHLLITDYDYFRSVIDDLQPKHFDSSESHVKLFKLIKKLWLATKKPLTASILENSIVQLHLKGFYSDGDVFGLNNILDAGKNLMPSEFSYIKENSINFLKHQSIAIAFSDALDDFESGNYDALYDKIGKAYKKTYGIGNTLGLDYCNASVFERYSEPPRKNIWPTQWEQFNKYLGGGFAKRECVNIVSSTGRGKCLGKNTPILMSDGAIKMSQDILVGDKLMGPDGKSRKVLSITSGQDNLYKIIPVKGMSYIVNSVHLLSLKTTKIKRDLNLFDKQTIKPGHTSPIFITAENLFQSNSTAKHCLKAWRPGPISFENESTSHTIPPYILGVWLGDGTSTKPEITQQSNSEVVQEFKNFALSEGYGITEHADSRNDCSTYRLTDGGRGSSNRFMTHLSALNLLNNKHIPKEYIFTSIENRLELLAGLLDTDGSVHYEGYDIIQKNKLLAEAIVFVARSLGFAVNISECTKGIKSTGFSGQYWRVNISGDCDRIPVRVGYKKAKPRKQIKNHLLTGITIEQAGYGNYYGFEIDGDKQFLLGDWQVTHNTSILCNLAIQAMKQKQKVVFYTLEMAEGVIAQRNDAILCGFSPMEISENSEIQVDLQKLLNQYKEYRPIIKEFPRGQISTQGIRNALDRYSMEYGSPDVVIVDWIGCLKLPQADKKHEAMAEAADDLVNMSRDYDCCLLTSQQTNRSAVGNDLFGYDSVSESFAALFGMDIVIGLGATDKAKDSGKRTLNILKSRVGPDSVYVGLQGNRSNETINYRFKEIPPEEEELNLLSPIEE